MKCLCGYEKKEKHHLEDGEITGKEEFIDIKGTFYIKGGDYNQTLREVSLVACPKCNTVQMIDF